ncbi:hypothetical protein FA13DRAFT_1653904 [Coprinellus micaceus]|uniref:Uncharacterized protein n=1 Tax=Coprinellus micaceus TaxID=71717 RepID=A0A4Y7RJB2_COPMI|nr:hypothetical protein FA13DRAFT_1653904 [Coprinellus micaceus]
MFVLAVTSAVCTSVALISTVYRLYIRRSRFWFDDACACCAMLFLFVQLAATFTPLSMSYNPRFTLVSPTRPNLCVFVAPASACAAILYHDHVFLYYCLVSSFRALRALKVRKRMLLVGAGGFFLICGFLIAQMYWTCEPEEAWKEYRIPQCPLSKANCCNAADFGPDNPLRLLVVLQDKWLRTRLMAIFSTCMITTAVSIVHAIFILRSKSPAIVIIALVESSVSLIVCNLPVMATSLLNLSEHSGGPRLHPPMKTMSVPTTPPGKYLSTSLVSTMYHHRRFPRACS